jgi:hypothetical protein
MVRAAIGHLQYASLPSGQEFQCVQTTIEQFHAVAECYAMCQVVAKITTLAQCNSCYLGGYRQVLLHILELELDCDHPNWSCQVVDMLAQTPGQPAVYVDRRVQFMTAIGEETWPWRRAHRAAVRRFALDGAKPTVNDRAAAQLDLRLTTRLTEFLSAEKIVEAEDAIKSAYVKYAIEQMKAAYEKLPAQPAKKSRSCSIRDR